MNQLLYFLWRAFFVCCVLLLSFSQLDFASVAAANITHLDSAMVTTLRDLRRAVTWEQGRVVAFDLNAIVLGVDERTGTVFLNDFSGTEILEVGLKGLVLNPGQQIRLYGTNYVSYAGIGLALGKKPIVDADGVHSLIEKSGTVHLKAGRHSVRVVWFNLGMPSGLKVDYSGPHFPRQKVSDDVLLHLVGEPGNESAKWVRGLTYRCFEGQWHMLPDFGSLVPIHAGFVPNFDLSVAHTQKDAGLEFQGFINLPEDGDYSFYLNSDDGSQLFIDWLPPNITVSGMAPLPTPLRIDPSQPLPLEASCLWAEAEGTVVFLSNNGRSSEFELNSGKTKMRVNVLNSTGGIPSYLVHSRVHVRGICLDTADMEGHRHAGLMLMPYFQDLQVNDVSPEQWAAFQSSKIGELGTNSGIVHLLGRLSVNPETHQVLLADATGSIPIELLSGLPPSLKATVECLGRWTWDPTNAFLHQAICRIDKTISGDQANVLPLLTNAIQVQQLKPEEANLKYPVTLRGVVTQVAEDFRNLTIQDSTRGVFVGSQDTFIASRPHVGDYCQIEGETRAGEFSPIVILRKLNKLSNGEMPQPVIPTRDQLLSASLDAQYVEIRGLVVAIKGNEMTLLSSDGMLQLNISPTTEARGESILNSVIRIRGCLLANWNEKHHAVAPVILRNVEISVDDPSSMDPFDAEKLEAGQLKKYDVRFDTFRREKVSGQILHHSADMYYIMDDATGLRFRPAQPVQFEPGDTVDVVGLLEWGKASPLLRQAVARKTGHSPLPPPRELLMNNLDDSYDSTRVWVEGILVDVKRYKSEEVFELQVGPRVFTARLDSQGLSGTSWAVGSRLKLTGVFCSLDSNRWESHKVNSFELLLNSPNDIQVVSQPSWWTLERLMVMVAMLIVGLSLAFVWITLLRRQVERRTIQLKLEMNQRERAERGRIIEVERSRIARDLHDDLGSQLTGLSMMASVSPGLKLTHEQSQKRMVEIATKSRTITVALDRLVWVIDSKNDTLTAMVEYLASYVEEFLAKAGIAVRFELLPSYPEWVIVAEIRNHLLLSVSESLNNAVRHGRPTEVLLRLVLQKNELEILIQDNGCGFEPGNGSLGNGLANLHERMTQLNGRCQITSLPGKGTSVQFNLPLSQSPQESLPLSQ
ncbi:MAG: Integral rane sensor signal transduction histidine kinase [Verrucomicrobiales bacterium]|nr:Integral rane sensor signal transduction histidine kinase [Verrucomicrobiales bacterium]